MRIKHLIGLASGMFIFSAGTLYAACDGGITLSCDPAFNGPPVVTITTIVTTAKNSASGTPNKTNSVYFFEATTGTIHDTTDLVNGNWVVIATVYTGSGNSNDVIPGDITPVVGNTLYNLWVQACPPDTQNPDTSGCSNWITLGSTTTMPYPPNPGFLNMLPADTAPQQVTAKTNGVQDSINVTSWQIVVKNDDADLGAGQSSPINQQPFSGQGNGAGAFTVTNNDYSSLGPNLGYQITENLTYHYNKAGPSTTIQFTPPNSAFFTQPVNPVALEPILNITHCSATLGFQNAASNPPNPFNSPYKVNVGGAVSGGSATQTVNIGGGAFTSSNSVTFSNLNSGQNYSPTVQALNRGGGSWLNSSTVNYVPGFQTIAWGGNFSMQLPVFNTSGTFVVASVDPTGISTWTILVNGLPTHYSGTGSPNGSYTLGVAPDAPLNPNTSNYAQIRVQEASGCFSILPATGTYFVTTPVAPIAPAAIVATAPRNLTVTFTDPAPPVGNAIPSVYELWVSTTSNFSSPIVKLPTKLSNGLQTVNLTTSDGLLPETTYYAEVRTRSLGRTIWPDSPWFVIGSTYTPNEAPMITSLSCTTVVGNIDTCNGTATDNGGGSQLLCEWSGDDGLGHNVSFNPSSGTAVGIGLSGTCPTTTATYPQSGLYTIKLTVIDHLGTGLQTFSTVFVGAGQTGNTIIIAPSSATLVAGNTQPFTATVLDQFGHPIVGQTVNWSVNGGGSLNSSLSVSTTFQATTPGSWVLTASTGTAQTTAAITVLGSGPFFTSGPSIALNSDNKTATISASASDNDGGYDPSTMQYVWTLSSGPAPVDLPPILNGSSVTATITFHAAGTYTLQCAISDPFGGPVYGITPSTTVVQVLNAITVAPNNITIQSFQNQQFTASGFDQFALSMPVNNVQWTSSGGTISGSGQFNSPSLGTNIRVTATVGRISGSAVVTVISYDISGSYAFPVPYKSNDGSGGVTFTSLGSDAKIRVYTISGRLVFNTETTNGSFKWPVTNNSGEKVASGVYYYVIESPSGKKDGKLIIIQ